MKSEEITLIGTLGGVITGALGTAAITWIREHYEEKRQHRKLVVETAVKYWEKGVDMLQTSKRGGKSWPLEAYILSMAHLVSKVLGQRLSPRRLTEILEENKGMVDGFEKFYNRKAKEQ